jgi:hypothetical protein
MSKSSTGAIRNAVRITVQRGKVKLNFVVTGRVIPQMGDTCTIDGEDWKVIRRESTSAYSITFPKAKVKKVFP